MPDVEIVHATPDDADHVAPLFDAYRVWYGKASDPDGARRFLTQRLANNESVVFLATLDGVAAGFTQLYPLFSSVSMEPVWLLNDLFVSDEYRQRGIGSLLLQTAAQFATELGAIRLELATEHDNQTAQALYRSLGWQPDTQFQHFALSLPVAEPAA